MRMSQRAAAVSGLAALTLTLTAGAASAHVTANPNTAEQGSYAKVSFRVPNEEKGADTTKLEIDLPADHPIASVSVRPQPGWQFKVEKAKLATPLKTNGGSLTEAVSKITWTGGKIAPGEFQEFDVSMGSLPTNTDRLMFKAKQTYSSGEVVNWDQDPGNGGGQEPEHPAPTVKLVPAAKDGSEQVAAGTPAKDSAAAPSSSSSSSDGTARLLGGLGLAVGIIGLGVGAYGLTRKRAS